MKIKQKYTMKHSMRSKTPKEQAMIIDIIKARYGIINGGLYNKFTLKPACKQLSVMRTYFSREKVMEILILGYWRQGDAIDSHTMNRLLYEKNYGN